MTYRFELAKLICIGKKFPHLGRARVVHPHGTVHELHSIDLARFENLVKLSYIKSHRLLEEHVLLLLGGEHGPAQVKTGRKWDIDGVDFGIIEYSFVRTIDSDLRTEPIIGRKFRGLFHRTTAYCRESGVGSKSNSSRNFASNLGGADDSETDDRVGHVCGPELWTLLERVMKIRRAGNRNEFEIKFIGNI